MTVFLGSAKDDSIFGTKDNDGILGFEGNDILFGLAGDDNLSGGAGFDTLVGDEGSDSLLGGDDHDLLAAGGGGNDTLDGEGGIDTADFGHLGPEVDLGDDVVLFADFLSGRRIDIRLADGDGEGIALVTTSNPSAVIEKTSLFRIENVLGSNASDRIAGNGDDNIVEGKGGHDTLAGGGGADKLFGGSGRDLLDGGLGSDFLDGGSGEDTVTLASFDEIFSPGVFRHVVDLGDGGANGFLSRSFALTSTQPFVETERDELVDIENVIGSNASDRIFGTAFNNRLEGRGGDDFIEGRGGAETTVGTFTLGPRDILDGGEGNDTVSYAYLDRFQFLSVAMRGTITLGEPGSEGRGLIEIASQVSPTFAVATDDILVNFENVFASNLSETITGNGEANRIEARGGNDVVDGGRGHDTLDGGAGTDTLDLAAWNSTSSGGSGGIVVTGVVTGVEVRLFDTFVTPDADFSFGVGRATLFSTRGGTDTIIEQDQVFDFENVIGTNRADTIGGNFAANRLTAGAGDDVVKGFGNKDTLDGGSGNDRIDGGLGNDKIAGGSGNDILVGSGGNDRITGGRGTDVMTGGSGKDRFVFNSAAETTFSARDTIVDFENGDLIDLSRIDAVDGLAGNQAFRFVGTGAFTAAGQVRAVILGEDDVVLLGNTDADALPEFAIAVRGDVTDAAGPIDILSLAADDFVL